MYLNALPRFSAGIISFCAWLSYSSLSYWDRYNRRQSKGTLLAGSTWTISCYVIPERATMATFYNGGAYQWYAACSASAGAYILIIQLPGGR